MTAEGIVCALTGTCRHITYIAKKLQNVWLAAQITVKQLQNTLCSYINGIHGTLYYVFLSHVLVKFYCDVHKQKLFIAYQHIN